MFPIIYRQVSTCIVDQKKVSGEAKIGLKIVNSKSNGTSTFGYTPDKIRCIFCLQMAIDTVFVCFAEDCEMNNGVTRPYFMSVGLMVC